MPFNPVFYPDTLTENFTWAEASITTHRDIENEIPEELISIIRNTAYGMERIRTLIGLPISISSWYRGSELNKAVGSEDTSQHLKGEAVDWICPKFGTPLKLVQKLIQFREYINYDQLILEHNWVHTSFQSNPDIHSRGQVLSLLKNRDPKTGRKYADGVTDNMGNPYYA